MAITSYYKEKTATGTYDVKNITWNSQYYGPTPTGPIVTAVNSWTVSSVKTPGFRHLRVKPENPYSKSFLKIDDPKFTWVLDVKDWRAPPEVGPNGLTGGYWNNTISTWTCERTGVPLYDVSAADDPTQKVISKIQNEIRLGKADLGTSLAEFGKTVEHIATTATRLAGALRALKKFDLGGMATALGTHTSKRQKRRFSKRRRALLGIPPGSKKEMEPHYWNFMASSWLEYSYAWKPLLNDVYNLCEATAQAMTERGPDVRYVRAKAMSVRKTVKGSNTPNWRGWTSVTEYFQVRKVSMKVGYKIDNGGASIAVAFGLTNPLTIAWELIPFSFVADWFLPIGTAISALSADHGLTFHSGSKTRILENSVKRTVTAISPPDTAVKISKAFGYGKGSNYSFTIDREVLTSFPTYGFPAFKDPRSFSHGLSAIALLQSIFLRK